MVGSEGTVPVFPGMSAIGAASVPVTSELSPNLRPELSRTYASIAICPMAFSDSRLALCCRGSHVLIALQQHRLRTALVERSGDGTALPEFDSCCYANARHGIGGQNGSGNGAG